MSPEFSSVKKANMYACYEVGNRSARDTDRGILLQGPKEKQPWLLCVTEHPTTGIVTYRSEYGDQIFDTEAYAFRGKTTPDIANISSLLGSIPLPESKLNTKLNSKKAIRRTAHDWILDVYAALRRHGKIDYVWPCCEVAGCGHRGPTHPQYE